MGRVAEGSTLLSISFERDADHRDLHSFPTRRSSDLLSQLQPGAPEGSAETKVVFAGMLSLIDGLRAWQSPRLYSSHSSMTWAVVSVVTGSPDLVTDRSTASRNTVVAGRSLSLAGMGS